MKLSILVSDLQLPLHHRRAVGALCNFLADKRKCITEVFQVGDFFDFTAISHWVDGSLSEDGRLFQRELDSSMRVMRDIHLAYPSDKIRIRGNHDDRLDKYLATRGRAVGGLRSLQYDVLTCADEYGWNTVAAPWKLAPRTVAVHGLCVRAKAGYTAHAHLDKMAGNVVHGHTHRAGLVYRTASDETRFAMEIGCLMDRRRAEYVDCGIADWQLAFGALWVDGNDVQPELVQINPSGAFIFDGKKYTP